MPLKAPKLHQAALAVQLPAQPSQATCASLVQAVLKHLLYARGHIPYLFDQLLQQVLEEQEQQQEQQQPGQPRVRRRRTRPKKSDKSRLQFLQRAVALFDTITPELFATDRPTHCFLLLGASTSRPREAYELLLPAAIPVGEELSVAEAARDDYACRVLLRQLISSAPDLPEGTAAEHPGKVYFLVQAPAGHEAYVGFSPKPSFRLAMRKGVHVTMSLGAAWVQLHEAQQQQQGQAHQAAEGTCPDVQGGQQAAESQEADKAVARGEGSVQASQGAGEQGGSVWLQSKWVLRGLKCNSDTPMG